MTKSVALAPEQAFGLVLRQVRVQAGLSQEVVAFESGLQRNFISLLELGHRAPTIKTIYKLATALKIRPSELIVRMESLTH